MGLPNTGRKAVIGACLMHYLYKHSSYYQVSFLSINRKFILMPFYKIIFSYLLTAVVFFAIDMIWLGVGAKNFYGKHLSNFLSEEVNWTAAIIFYLLFIVGIFLFTILPAVEKQSWTYALIYGGLFGFFTYATYDLTHLAPLNNWPMKVVIVDILWGMVLTASVSISGYHITQWFNK